jgi:hypothetical protein
LAERDDLVTELDRIGQLAAIEMNALREQSTRRPSVTGWRCESAERDRVRSLRAMR